MPHLVHKGVRINKVRELFVYSEKHPPWGSLTAPSVRERPATRQQRVLPRSRNARRWVRARAGRGYKSPLATAARLDRERHVFHSAAQARTTKKLADGGAGVAQPSGAVGRVANMMSGVSQLFSGNKVAAAPVVLDGAREGV